MQSRGRRWSSFILQIICQARESQAMHIVLENSCHIAKTPQACYKDHWCLVFSGPLVTTEDDLWFTKVSSYCQNILWKGIGSVYCLHPPSHRTGPFIGSPRYETRLNRVSSVWLYFISKCSLNVFRANRSLLAKDSVDKLTASQRKVMKPGASGSTAEERESQRDHSAVWPAGRFSHSCLCRNRVSAPKSSCSCCLMGLQ